MTVQKKALQVYRYLQRHLKVLQNSLTLLSLITLLSCKQISGYFSNYNPELWFDYFVITERFSMMLLLLSVYGYLKTKSRLVTELLLFFLVQDFIDRVLCDITEWGINDTIGLSLISLQFIIRNYGKQKISGLYNSIHIYIISVSKKLFGKRSDSKSSNPRKSRKL